MNTGMDFPYPLRDLTEVEVRRLYEYMLTLVRPALAVEVQREEIARRQRRIDQLCVALMRLRDCDWVISLPDRMDAVRDIARKALEGRDD